MPNDAVARRTEMIRGRVRKLVRKGARQHLRRLLAKVRPEEVPVVMTGLTEDESLEVFRLLQSHFPESVGEVLTGMDVADRRPLVESLSDDEIVEVVESVQVDDAVEIVENLSGERREAVMDLVESRRISVVHDHLLFEDDTAGRIMTTEFFALPQTTRVREAVASIQSAQNVEMIFYVFVTDDDGRLVGVTSLRQLLLGKPDTELSAIMTRSVVKVSTDGDQERVAQLAARYDLLAIPVVDEDERLVGIITVDDIIDVVQEEANEDIFKMVGSSDDELNYDGHSWRVVGIRLPWILVNGLGLLISGQVPVTLSGGHERCPLPARLRSSDHGDRWKHRQPDLDRRGPESGFGSPATRPGFRSSLFRLPAVSRRGRPGVDLCSHRGRSRHAGGAQRRLFRSRVPGSLSGDLPGFTERRRGTPCSSIDWESTRRSRPRPW